MRWVNMAVIIIFAVATPIFCSAEFPNRCGLNFKISAPHALLIVFIYLPGMVTGGSLWH